MKNICEYSDDIETLMSDTNLYIKKCAVIKNLIKDEFKGHKFDYRANAFGGMTIVINDKATLSIESNITWNEIKRNIYKKINPDTSDNTCGICFYDLNRRVSCNKCANFYCTECYINLYKIGEGLISCPFCRHTVGVKISKSHIDMGAIDMGIDC